MTEDYDARQLGMGLIPPAPPVEDGVPADRIGRDPGITNLLPHLKGRRDPNAWAAKRITVLKALSLGYSKTRACQYAGIARDTLNAWENDDEGFKKDVQAAIEVGVDVLEDEMRRRAFEGTLEPRMSKDQTFYVRRFSDALLALALKARRPHVYRERHEHTGPDGTPLPAGGAQVVFALNVLPHGFDKLPEHAQARLLEVLQKTDGGS